MMDAIVITGVQPFDGEYELEFEESPFTTLEWRWIKQIAGYLPRTINEGWEGADPDLILAMAVIAMHRANKITREQVLLTATQLADVPVDGASIVLHLNETVEDDARPPDPSESTVSSPTGSGEGSKPPTAPLENGQKHTGEPTSLMHVTSGQQTSAT